MNYKPPMRSRVDNDFDRFLRMMQEHFSSDFDSVIDSDLYKRLSAQVLDIVSGKDNYQDKDDKELSSDDLYAPVPSDDDNVDNRSKIPVETIRSVENFLMFYYGKTFDLRTRLDIVWRLTACRKRFKKGQNSLAEYIPIPPDWYEMRVEDARFLDSANQDGRIVMLVELAIRLIDGPFGGLRFRQRVPYKFLIGSFAHTVGFRYFKDVCKGDFVGCAFIGLFDTSRDIPMVTKFDAKHSQKSKNTQKYRARRTACKYGFTWSCPDCSLGHAVGGEWSYGTQASRCMFATHSATYVKKFCPECLKEGFFDPIRKDKSCLNCTEGKYENWAKFLQEHD